MSPPNRSTATRISSGRSVTASTVVLGRVPPIARERLADELYDVYIDRCYGLDRDGLARAYLGDPEARLRLFRDDVGRLIGYTIVTLRRCVVNGRTMGVLAAPVLARSGARIGDRAGMFGLREAVRLRVRHPLLPLVYVTRIANAASYCLLARNMTIWPNRHEDTPAWIADGMKVVADAFGWESFGTPLRAFSGACPRDTALPGSLVDDPDAQWFQSHGLDDVTDLVAWVPLDVANVTTAFFNLLRRGR